MDLFNSLPLKKQEYMNRLFRNCTEEVKYYMSVIDVEADRTFIKAGEECKYIYIILSGKVTGVEWPMHEKSYFFKDFGPGDFFGEIECFAGLTRYRISILSSTKCRLLAIPSIYYMEWMRMDVDALFMRTQENISRLVLQTAEARKYLFMEGRDRLMVHRSVNMNKRSRHRRFRYLTGHERAFPKKWGFLLKLGQKHQKAGRDESSDAK